MNTINDLLVRLQMNASDEIISKANELFRRCNLERNIIANSHRIACYCLDIAFQLNQVPFATDVAIDYLGLKKKKAEYINDRSKVSAKLDLGLEKRTFHSLGTQFGCVGLVDACAFLLRKYSARSTKSNLKMDCEEMTIAVFFAVCKVLKVHIPSEAKESVGISILTKKLINALDLKCEDTYELIKERYGDQKTPNKGRKGQSAPTSDQLKSRSSHTSDQSKATTPLQTKQATRTTPRSALSSISKLQGRDLLSRNMARSGAFSAGNSPIVNIKQRNNSSLAPSPLGLSKKQSKFLMGVLGDLSDNDNPSSLNDCLNSDSDHENDPIAQYQSKVFSGKTSDRKRQNETNETEVVSPRVTRSRTASTEEDTTTPIRKSGRSCKIQNLLGSRSEEYQTPAPHLRPALKSPVTVTIPRFGSPSSGVDTPISKSNRNEPSSVLKAKRTPSKKRKKDNVIYETGINIMVYSN